MSNCSWCKNPALGLLFVRLAVGIPFVVAGFTKWSAMSQTIEGFTAMGFPAAAFCAYLVATVELVGGLAVILGIYTRYVAPLFVIIMLVAIFTVHFKAGYVAGYQYQLALLLASLGLTFTGCGLYSVLKLGRCCSGGCNTCTAPSDSQAK